jgi:hypothetical protein
VHNGIKPEKVFITEPEDSVPKIGDLGRARPRASRRGAASSPRRRGKRFCSRRPRCRVYRLGLMTNLYAFPSTPCAMYLTNRTCYCSPCAKRHRASHLVLRFKVPVAGPSPASTPALPMAIPAHARTGQPLAGSFCNSCTFFGKVGLFLFGGAAPAPASAPAPRPCPCPSCAFSCSCPSPARRPVPDPAPIALDLSLGHNAAPGEHRNVLWCAPPAHRPLSLLQPFIPWQLRTLLLAPPPPHQRHNGYILILRYRSRSRRRRSLCSHTRRQLTLMPGSRLLQAMPDIEVANADPWGSNTLVFIDGSWGRLCSGTATRLHGPQGYIVFTHEILHRVSDTKQA